MKRRILPLLTAAIAVAHPMGNFSVNHYTRLDVSAKGVNVTYVLDLAEIPTYQLFKEWKVDAKSPGLDEKAATQAREWMQGLEFRSGDHRIEPTFVGAEIKVSNGAGGLAVARIVSTMRIDDSKGKLEFEDHNFPERAGWKEIVIGGGGILKASQGDVDRSKALTEYPADPTVAPPQDLRASVEWQTAPVVTTRVAPTKIVPIVQPEPAVTQAATPAPSPAAPPAPGTVVRGDFLSRMLGNREIGLGLMLLGIGVAFGLGAVHALSPGHGKTIVAAYLVGSRGTMRHAAFLGGIVTFTHTISVFALGLATLFISKYIVPEKIIPVLGAISGLSIVVIGGSLFFKRLKRLRAGGPHAHPHPSHDHDHVHSHAGHDHDHEHAHAHVAHHHDHAHPHDHSGEHDQVHSHPGHDHDHQHEHAHAHVAHHHDHSHPHDHSHEHDHVHDHVHGKVAVHHHDHEPDHAHARVAHHHDHPHDHDHGPHGHSHVPEGDITLGSLIALGASGGLVPCPSALVLLLSAIAVGHVGLGLVLLVSFSLGLAVVLMAIGMLVLYAKHLLPDPSKTSQHPAFRLVPVLSAFVIVCLGLLMTGVSLGWVRPGGLAG